MHLLTSQAFEIYLKHVKENGLFAVHISNRYLDLRPVLLALGQKFGLTARVVETEKTQKEWWARSSVWVLLTKNDAILSNPKIVEASQLLDENLVAPVQWTDERTSLLHVLRSMDGTTLSAR